jgi:prepilin-type N-terminal cleavage/methylation domain-containing protein
MMKQKNSHHNALLGRLESAGFTLIEMIIVIAIMSILAGAMAPMAVQMIGNSRRDATLKRQQLIYQAIWGDPELHGTGFLSDIGRIPDQDLMELVVGKNALGQYLPLYAVQASGVGAGWRGPYLLDGVDNTGRPLDAWGTPMDFTNGQIRSAGPDQVMSTADDLCYPSTPITANNVYGSISLEVEVLDTAAAPPKYVPINTGQVTYYYAKDGAILPSALPIASSNMASVKLHQGIHAISVKDSVTSLTSTLTVFCPAGRTVHQTIVLR